MNLTKVQKTFIRLATNRQNPWNRFPRLRVRRRRLKSWAPCKQVNIEIINAVTGEKTTARANEESHAKLKKWLKLRNLRAEFVGMVLPKNSTFSKLTDEEFKNYPVIVRVGTYKVPYLIDHIRAKFSTGKKITCNVFLKITDNLDYLQIIDEKKDLLKKKSK